MSEIILGIETSGEETGLAFVENQQILYELKQTTGAHHNETIYDFLTQALQTLRIEIQNLAGICVSIGPGMFTSLRIGVALAKGLALPFDIRIVGVNTLDGLAESAASEDRLVVPLIDARKGEVFSALYKGGKRISDYAIVQPAELILRIGEPALFLGNGLEKIEGFLQEKLGDRFQRLAENIRTPHASTIAFLGARRLSKNEFDRIDDLEPFYFRRTDAEVAKEKKGTIEPPGARSI
jgi:tRNA threonylcarbamoyladenosine biosynthesis protein TsaB